MTEPLGLTPSQTAGPYLSIGLLRDLVPAALLDPADPRTIRISGRLLDGAGDGVGDAVAGPVEQAAADPDCPRIARVDESRRHQLPEQPDREVRPGSL